MPTGPRFIKLGYKDSNLEMTESESVALPFGDSPSTQRNVLYNIVSVSSSTFFNFYPFFAWIFLLFMDPCVTVYI